MKFLKIIILHAEQVFEQRLRSLVWFFVSVINPLVLILFWAGAGTATKEIIPNWTISRLNSYYLLIMVASPLLSSHIEEDIAFYDIQLGELVKYLVRPFPYYWIKMFEELPYRILQGAYGMVLLFLVSVFFGNILNLARSPLILFSAAITAVLGFFISHTFKMIEGLITFWLEDIRGFMEVIDVVIVVLGGLVIPLDLMPQAFKSLAQTTPFAYFIYYPIMAFQQKNGLGPNLQIIFNQILWLIVLFTAYRLIWKRGIKKFTGYGQ